jgi:hypothetical protein
MDTVMAKTTFQSLDLLQAIQKLTFKHALIDNNTFLVLKTASGNNSDCGSDNHCKYNDYTVIAASM